MLPPTIPIFPLPNVVLFPQVFLPLHIFEPRYRSMVADAIGGDRLIGVVLLRPGWESDYDGRPAVFPVGCAGVITHHDRLPDGRFNIVLRGLEKFRITGEESDRLYRVAHIDSLEERLDGHREEIAAARQRLEGMLIPKPRGRGADESGLPISMSDEDLVNTLAQYMDLEPLEKQALLERSGPLDRCRSLIELLEMKLMLAKHDWSETN
jgi:Lon protease-like protein